MAVCLLEPRRPAPSAARAGMLQSSRLQRPPAPRATPRRCLAISAIAHPAFEISAAPPRPRRRRDSSTPCTRPAILTWRIAPLMVYFLSMISAPKRVPRCREGKPIPTFPDHALFLQPQGSAICARLYIRLRIARPVSLDDASPLRFFGEVPSRSAFSVSSTACVAAANGAWPCSAPVPHSLAGKVIQACHFLGRPAQHDRQTRRRHQCFELAAGS